MNTPTMKPFLIASLLDVINVSKVAVLLAGLCLSMMTHAGDGHDHGTPTSTSGSPALPRMSAVSETFEIVGVLKGKHITLYLDRFNDNSPVRDAILEVDIAGSKYKAEKHGDGEYELELKETPKPGNLSLSVSVTVGTEADLLAGEFDLHAPAAPTTSASGLSAQKKVFLVFGGLIGLLILSFLIKKIAKIFTTRGRRIA